MKMSASPWRREACAYAEQDYKAAASPLAFLSRGRGDASPLTALDAHIFRRRFLAVTVATQCF